MKVHWSGTTSDGAEFSEEYSGVEHASPDEARAEINAAEEFYYGPRKPDLFADGPFFWID